MKSLATLSIVALAAPAFADTYVVELYSSSFSPDVVNVVPGDVVRFEYVTGYPHTATSGMPCTPDGLYFDESLSSPGDYLEWTVPSDAPAEVPFFCIPHCEMGMTGMINVALPSGHMVIGLVDISNPSSMTYWLDSSTDTAYMNIDCDGSIGSSFALGVEIEETEVNVDIEVVGSVDAHMLQVSTGTDTVLSTGSYTLTAGERYLFHGDTIGKNYLNFLISWPETGSEDDIEMSQVNLSGQGSINSSGDSLALHAANSGSYGSLVFNADVAGEIFLGVLGDVTCSTLTLPPSGEEGTITVPAGTHTIAVTGLGMLWIPDDGDGGGLPEDVDGDGVVGVGDLLAIIAVWGATSP